MLTQAPLITDNVANWARPDNQMHGFDPIPDGVCRLCKFSLRLFKFWKCPSSVILLKCQTSLTNDLELLGN